MRTFLVCIQKELSLSQKSRRILGKSLERRGADAEGMWGTFNMGIGFILAVSADKADEIVAHFNANAEKFATEAYKKCGVPNLKAYRIGEVAKSEKELGGDLKGSHEATILY